MNVEADVDRNVCKPQGVFHTNHLTNQELASSRWISSFQPLDTRGSSLRASQWVLSADSASHFSFKTVKPTEPAETGKIKSELFRRYFPYLKDKAEIPNEKKESI